jgi:hypothetical protein
MLSNYLGFFSTTSCQQSKFSTCRFSDNCHTGMGECQISGQSNPASCLPSTKGNQGRIWLAYWLSNSHAATLSNFGESLPRQQAATGRVSPTRVSQIGGQMGVTVCCKGGGGTSNGCSSTGPHFSMLFEGGAGKHKQTSSDPVFEKVCPFSLSPSLHIN